MRERPKGLLRCRLRKSWLGGFNYLYVLEASVVSPATRGGTHLMDERGEFTPTP